MSGIYLHIPYCKQTCSYCDFHFSTSLKSKEAFLSSLLTEIELQRNYLGKGALIETVYFGGGTPSLLFAEELDKIFTALHKNFDIAKNAEITLETNPDDLNNLKLRELKASPVNRISIGAQSFFNSDLKLMNRKHNAEQALKCVEESLAVGFENITVDLIFGTPGLSNVNWKKNLEKLFNLGIPHISAYALTIEEKTPLDYRIKKGKVKPVNEKQSVEQFLILMDETSENGYEQYEISNFGKPGFFSRHNSSYWNGKKYLGLGPSAHSFDGNSRQWNISNNFRYINTISKNSIPCEKETLSENQKFNEYVMIRLRTSEGISLSEVAMEFGDNMMKSLLTSASPYFDSGHIIKEENYLKLSTKGKLIADRISSEFFI